ncbi:MAG: CPBP family intramembrane metalloprotease, partial [Actinomycetota bacterium]|nr:CPBP family intramembrane metalloprotease [Actinomycetota bacterium]
PAAGPEPEADWGPPTTGWPTPPPPRAPYDRGVVVTAALAIGLGAILQLAFYLLARGGTIEPEAAARYDLVGVLLFYCVVAALLVRQLGTAPRLRWSNGPPALAVALGLGVGAGTALLGQLAFHGHGDDTIGFLMSEGDLPRIVAAFVISTVAAPLVEELLFRGLVLESLRNRHGVRGAIWLSAFAFALWHWRPALLRYYAVLGAILGLLYVRRGLACSMSAHAGFNAVLSVAALVYVTGPASTVAGPGFSLRAPSGWHSAQLPVTAPAGAVYLEGPSGSSVVVTRQSTVRFTTVEDLLARVDQLPTGTFGHGATGHQVELPAGAAAQIDLENHGHRGTIVELPSGQTLLFLLFTSGGSYRATRDLQAMLSSLALSP